MTNIMARPDGNPYFFAQHQHSPGFDPESRQHQSSPREWYSSNLQTHSPVSVEARDEICNVYASSSQNPADSTQSWAKALLLDCARAIAEKDTSRVQSIMWILNESASPYGDSDQRLMSYFVQALVCKITDTGSRCHRSLTSAAEKTYSFESMRNMILNFQVRRHVYLGCWLF